MGVDGPHWIPLPRGRPVFTVGTLQPEQLLGVAVGDALAVGGGYRDLLEEARAAVIEA